MRTVSYTHLDVYKRQQEHFDLRAAMQKKQGTAFNLKAYHDQVLSYGAPPVRYVRELMLDEPIR